MIQSAANSLVLAGVYLLFSLGMSITWGTVGILNFAHGANCMFAAFICYVVSNHVRLPLVAMIVIGIAVGAVLSTLAQIIAFDPIFRLAENFRDAELQVLIAGLGLAAIPMAIAQEQTEDNPFGLSKSSFTVDTHEISHIRITNANEIIIGFGLILGIAIAVWLNRSRSGLALRAIGVDSETATIMGINRRAQAVYVMAISGSLAGLAGVLLTYSVGAVSPETGDNLLIKGFALIVLGGVGSVAGAMTGALILAVAETYVITETSGTWVDAVSFGILFLVLILRPQGLFGRPIVTRS